MTQQGFQVLSFRFVQTEEHQWSWSSSTVFDNHVDSRGELILDTHGLMVSTPPPFVQQPHHSAPFVAKHTHHPARRQPIAGRYPVPAGRYPTPPIRRYTAQATNHRGRKPSPQRHPVPTPLSRRPMLQQGPPTPQPFQPKVPVDVMLSQNPMLSFLLEEEKERTPLVEQKEEKAPVALSVVSEEAITSKADEQEEAKKQMKDSSERKSIGSYHYTASYKTVKSKPTD